MSLSYELALELKKAGFPQDGRNETPDHGGDLESWAYYPSLSELIEACEEGDFRLDNSTMRSLQIWHATFLGFEDRAQVFQGRGSTPEEAVARLWLALQKK